MSPHRSSGPRRWLLGGGLLVGGMGLALWLALRLDGKDAGEVKERSRGPLPANPEAGHGASEERLHLSSTGDVFPWDGVTVLMDEKGRTLSWTVQRVAGEVWISGAHPAWTVEHRAKPDGTPLSTFRKTSAGSTRVTWTDEGATLEHTDSHGKTSRLTVKEKGLWDGETLDVRLAGFAWSAGKRARMRILDVDLADGSTYPMVAEYVGREVCGAVPCHHVRLSVDDFRRLVAPTFEYRYATAPGARFLQYDGDGLRFLAR